MKAVLDHIGIAVQDLNQALAFYRDALGLEIEATEEVVSQRVRAHFVPVGESKLELLEATAPDSPIARYVEKRGAGLHHITLRVDDIAAALAQLKSRRVRLIDEQPRPGAEHSLVAFIHPSAAHGVLVELKQDAAQVRGSTVGPASAPNDLIVRRFQVGDLELISLFDGYFRPDGGAIFGVVAQPQWSPRFPPDHRNRIRLGLRPLVIRGVRTMLVDSGFGAKQNDALGELYAFERERHLDHALAEAGLTPEDIDIVLATHLHFDHAGGFTVRDGTGRIRPRFPRARYVARRGEWEDATHPNDLNRSIYYADDVRPLADAGVLDLVDDDQTIMPGVRVRRTGGHTSHHQAVWIESGGRRAVYAGDLVPTTAHIVPGWIAALDLYPLDSLTAKGALLKEAADGRTLVLFGHDPAIAAGYLVERDGAFHLTPA